MHKLSARQRHELDTKCGHFPHTKLDIDYTRFLILFMTGGLIYMGMEILYRGYTHWAMGIVGGLSLILVGYLNETVFGEEWPLCKQMAWGAFIITSLEFISGVILNLILGWDVWDYSDMPFNILGQICLPFTIMWFFVALFAIVVDDFMRAWLYEEEWPKYKFF